MSKRPSSKVPSKTRRVSAPQVALKEEPVEDRRIVIGPPKLTRFERARIIGARALQLALGAPPFVSLRPEIKDPITLAISELESKALPISIRRSLPDGSYQDIPLEWLL